MLGVLFDEQDLAEITSPDFSGERLVCCRTPALAEERARKREDPLAATEKALAPLIACVRAGRLADAAKIGIQAGRSFGLIAEPPSPPLTATELAE
jgi:hypothetical protein